MKYRIKWNHKIDQVVFAVHQIAPLNFTFFLAHTYRIFTIHFPTHMFIWWKFINFSTPQSQRKFILFNNFQNYHKSFVRDWGNDWDSYEVTLMMCLFVTKIVAIYTFHFDDVIFLFHKYTISQLAAVTSVWWDKETVEKVRERRRFWCV